MGDGNGRENAPKNAQQLEPNQPDPNFGPKTGKMEDITPQLPLAGQTLRFTSSDLGHSGENQVSELKNPAQVVFSLQELPHAAETPM